MNRAGFLTGAIVAFLLMAGCQSSTGPSNSYPLFLTVQDTSVNNTGVFDFRVTKNDGTPVANAQLRRTDFPSNQTTDLGLKSDSNGYFHCYVFIAPDTVISVAFQAVRDSLASNYIRWPQG